MGEIFKVRILRFDPRRQEQPCYCSYEVEADKKPTVLELLKEIYRKHDGEISFRWSCGTGKCGSCAVRINGRRVLACQHLAGEKEFTVEPMGDFPVIKDLMVALDEGNCTSRLQSEIR